MNNDKYKMVQDLADGWREKYEDAKQQLVKAQMAIDEHTYWKAKALDLEVKRDIAVSTLEKVKADRSVAKKALAEQCAETKRLRAEIEQLKAIVGMNLETYQKAASVLRNERDQLRAQINVLRDAFQTFIDEHEECQDADEWMAELCSIEALHVAGEALATTPEQSLAAYRNKVIEAFVNEFTRHVGGDGEFWLHELQDFAMKEQP